MQDLGAANTGSNGVRRNGGDIVEGSQHFWVNGENERRYAPNVMGHMDPCRAQLAILSNVESTYSALFEGVSKLSWFEPRFAICVMGSAGLVESVGMVEGDEAGRDE